MADLTRDKVAHIAHLSRLQLSEEEIDLYSRQLQDIVHYMDIIQEVNTEGVAAVHNPSAMINNLRADTVQPALSQESVLSMAPAQEDGRFSVPQMLGE